MAQKIYLTVHRINVSPCQGHYSLDKTAVVASNAGGTPMPYGGTGVFCNHQKNNSISFSSTEISKEL